MTPIESISIGFYPAGISERLEYLNKQLNNLPDTLDEETLDFFRENAYDVTLRKYKDVLSYKNAMTSLYGNLSANGFNSAINNYLGIKSDKVATAMEFIEGLQNKGVSTESAFKLYTALKSYTSLNTMLGGNNSFVSAKI